MENPIFFDQMQGSQAVTLGPKQSKEQSREQKRKEHNLELIKRMKEGESLEAYDSTASWFPPRPVIKKDKKAIAKLYPPTPPTESNENQAKGEEPTEG